MEKNVKKIPDTLIEPLEYYDSIKEEFKEEVEKFFDELLEKSNIDREYNEILSKEYENFNQNYKKIKGDFENKKTNGNFLKFSIFLNLIFIVFLILKIFLNTEYKYYYFFGIGDFNLISLLGIIFFALLFYKFKIYDRSFSKLENEVRDMKIKLDNKLLDCYKSMESLNKLMDSSYVYQLINKYIPIIHLDDYFNIERYNELVDYGFYYDSSKNVSTEEAISGNILGNPFVLLKEKISVMIPYTYTGTKHITWREQEVDSEGKLRTVVKSETLYAYVTKDKPEYKNRVLFILGNEAVENLSFSRSAGHIEKLSENKLNSLINKGEKELRAREKESLKKEKAFTAMLNSEFEVLFNALNRNNEQEFRMLFTPLAQVNMVKLLKNKKYGDNFSYIKSNQLNIIDAEHSYHWDWNLDFNKFKSYSHEKSKKYFVNYIAYYFENLFFIMAPIIAIPLLQQHKSLKYIYGDFEREKTEKYNNYIGEIMANALNINLFSHYESGTDEILKAELMEKNKFKVKSHSYKIKGMVDYVPVWGGDGRVHDVPVYWNLYQPLVNESEIYVEKFEKMDEDMDQRIKEGKFYDSNKTIFKNKFLTKYLGN